MGANIAGSHKEVRITANRAVKSGHLHEGPGSTVGYYSHGNDAASGDEIVLSLCEKLEIDAESTLVLAAGASCSVNFTTQKLVASGGTACGRVVTAKANGETKATIILNNGANPVA